MSKEFQWTNNKVREFAEWYRIFQGKPTPGTWGKDLLEHWLSHQQEWEVVAYKAPYMGDNDVVIERSGDLTWRTLTGYHAGDRVAITEKDSQNFKIYRVRRLSDGEVFSVGDEVGGVIQSFAIQSGQMFAYVGTTACRYIHLSHLMPKSKPIEKPIDEELNWPIPTEEMKQAWERYKKSYVFKFDEIKDKAIKDCIELLVNNGYVIEKANSEEHSVRWWHPYYTEKQVEDAFNAARIVCGVPLAHVPDHQLTRENVSADQLNLRHKNFQDYKNQMRK